MLATVIGFTLISLGIYQVSMAIYFYFYKLAPGQAVVTIICAAVTLFIGIYFNFVKIRIARKAIHSHIDEVDIDANEFKDEYLHPCIKKQRDYENLKEKEMPIVVDLNDLDIDDETPLLSLN